MIPAFVAVGALDWAVIGSMVLAGAVRVHRSRKRSVDTGNGPPEYCPNCGTEPDDDGVFATDDPDDERDVGYCSACGAPNDHDDDACEHCEAAL